MTTETKPETKTHPIADVAYHAPVHLLAATDDSRPALTGVHIKGTSDGTVFTAADGFAMAIYVDKTAVEDQFEVLVPRAFMVDLWKQVTKRKVSDVYKRLHVWPSDDRKVGFMNADDGAWRTCDTIDAKFPNAYKIANEAIDAVFNGKVTPSGENHDVSFGPEQLRRIGDFFKRCGSKAVHWLPGGGSSAQVYVGEADPEGLVSVIQMPMFTERVTKGDVENYLDVRVGGLKRTIEHLEAQLAQAKNKATK